MKLENAARDSHRQDTLICDLEDRGFTIVYVDASSEKMPNLGCVRGYGIFSERLHAVGAQLPTHLRQTNNTAEIFAAFQMLKLFLHGKVAICTDLTVVYLGATGKARKWVLNNWVGSQGPLSNVNLWKELLCKLDSPHRSVEWVKDFSHVGIQGNEEADSVAELAPLSSPLLYHSLTPVPRFVRRSVALHTRACHTTLRPAGPESDTESVTSCDGVPQELFT